MKAKTYAVIAASMVCCLLTGCGKTEINVNEYIKTDLTGYNGGGNVSMTMDVATLVANNYEAFGLTKDDSGAKFDAVIQKLKPNLDGSFDKQSDLSNGDKVKFTWDDSKIDIIEDTYKVKILLDDVSMDITDLPELQQFNPFDYIDVTFKEQTDPEELKWGNTVITEVSIREECPIPDLLLSIGGEDSKVGGEFFITVRSPANKSYFVENYCLQYGMEITETKRTYTVQKPE